MPDLTHEIISINLEDIPVYDSIESAEADTPLGKVPSGTETAVVDFFLGDTFCYATIAIPEGDFSDRECVVRNQNLVPLPDVDFQAIKPVDDGRVSDTSQKDIKIQDVEPSEPYYDKKNKTYCIVLDTGEMSTETIDEDALLSQGLSELFAYYGKNVLEEEVPKYLNYFGFVKVDGYHYPVRPGHGIRARVCVESKYLDAVKNITYEGYYIQNIYKDFLSVPFKTKDFEKNIEKIMSMLKKYDSQVLKFSGQLKKLNFGDVAADVKIFFTKIKKMLLANGVVLDAEKDHRIEIGFDKECFKLEYVIYYENVGKFLPVGVNKLREFVNPKLAKALIKFNDIIASGAAGTSWTDFAEDIFGGEFEISFAPPTGGASAAAKKLAGKITDTKTQFNDNPFKSATENSSLSATLSDVKFREEAALFLGQSEDFVGDNFIKNLPEIVDNVDNLETLYSLVFDKVSVKDVADIIMEKVSEELNIPDINEVKIRGIFKALRFDDMLSMLMSALDVDAIMELLLKLCLEYDFVPEEVDDFILSLDTNMKDALLRYDSSTDNFVGLYADYYSGDLKEKLAELGISDGDTLYARYSLKNIYQKEAISQVVCSLTTDGLPDYYIPPSSMNLSLMGNLKKLDKGKIKIVIDSGLKELFKGIDIDGNLKFPDIYEALLKHPKIKIEIDKLSKTKKSFLQAVPGVPVMKELPKLEASFELPKMKAVNPSFDFGKFQFKKTDDIFGGMIDSIGDGIQSGIEGALVGAFKGVLKGLLSSLKNGSGSNLRAPDFGGESLGDLMDASNGYGVDKFTQSVLPALQDKLSSLIDGTTPCATAVTVESVSEDDVTSLLSEISEMMSPSELYNISRGDFGNQDINNILIGLQNDAMKQILDSQSLRAILEEVSSGIDNSLIDELEDMIESRAVINTLCERLNVPYGDTRTLSHPPSIKSLKDGLKEKYASLADDEEFLQGIIDETVENTKDSIVDALGALKGDFDESLPFDDNPCSFMPSPADVPVMSFVNGMFFNTIFDNVKTQYKKDAADFPDSMMMSSQSSDFVKMFLRGSDGDTIIESIAADGYTPVEATVQGNIWNSVFENKYQGYGQTLYLKSTDSAYLLYEPVDIPYVQVPAPSQFGTDDPVNSNPYEFTKAMVESGGTAAGFSATEAAIDLWADAEETATLFQSLSTRCDENLYIQNPDVSLYPAPAVQGTFNNFQDYSIHWQGNPYDGRVTGDFTLISGHHTPAAADNIGGSIRFNLSASLAGNLTSGVVYPADPTNAECKDTIESNVTESADHPAELFANMLLADYYNAIGHTNAYFHNCADLSLYAFTMMAEGGMVKPGNWQLLGDKPLYTEYNQADLGASSAPGITDTTRFSEARTGTELSTYTDVTTHSSRPLDSSYYVRLTNYLMKFMAQQMAESPLFDTLKMQAFSFEEDAFSLLDAEQAKKEAIDDYNENCSFTENDTQSQQEKSAMKKLVELTIKIYLIDILVRGCFVYDKVYQSVSFSDIFFEIFYSNLKQGIRNYGTLYESIFLEQLAKQFEISLGTTIEPAEMWEDTNFRSKIKDVATEQYDKITASFPDIFINAKPSLLDLIFSLDSSDSGDGIHLYNAGVPDDTTPRRAYNLYKENLRLFNAGRHPLPFCVQVVIHDSGAEASREQLYTGGSYEYTVASATRTVQIEYRLCYIEKATDAQFLHVYPPRYSYDTEPSRPMWYASTEGAIATGEGTAGEYSTTSDAYGDDIMENILGSTASKNPDTTNQNLVMKNSVSYFVQFHATAGSDVQAITGEPIYSRAAEHDETTKYAKLVLVPLASHTFTPDDAMDPTFGSTIMLDESEIIGAGLETILPLLKDASEDFFYNKMALGHYYDYLLLYNIQKVSAEVPTALTAFDPTKDILKRAMESLAQPEDVYDFEDSDTKDLNNFQISEVSTTPNFSKIAAKMAMQTIPILLKGLAEQFDPNVKLASKVRMGADIAGVFIPPPLASLMCLPMNIIPPIFGGIGPPIGPLGLSYLATGFLEPKERKRFKEIMKGENKADGTDDDGMPIPVEGGTVGGYSEHSDDSPYEPYLVDPVVAADVLEGDVLADAVLTDDFTVAADKEFIDDLYDEFLEELRELAEWASTQTAYGYSLSSSDAVGDDSDIDSSLVRYDVPNTSHNVDCTVGYIFQRFISNILESNYGKEWQDKMSGTSPGPTYTDRKYVKHVYSGKLVYPNSGEPDVPWDFYGEWDRRGFSPNSSYDNHPVDWIAFINSLFGYEYDYWKISELGMPQSTQPSVYQGTTVDVTDYGGFWHSSLDAPEDRAGRWALYSVAAGWTKAEDRQLLTDSWFRFSGYNNSNGHQFARARLYMQTVNRFIIGLVNLCAFTNERYWHYMGIEPKERYTADSGAYDIFSLGAHSRYNDYDYSLSSYMSSVKDSTIYKTNAGVKSGHTQGSMSARYDQAEAYGKQSKKMVYDSIYKERQHIIQTLRRFMGVHSTDSFLHGWITHE